MTRPISAITHAAIETAMERLLNADDGAMPTIARLAAEAGLSRATLYRAPALLDRFRAATEQYARLSVSVPPSVDRIGELEAEIAMLHGQENDEIRELRVTNRNMAQHIQALSLLVTEQERQITRLQVELSEGGRVVPLVAPAPG